MAYLSGRFQISLSGAARLFSDQVQVVIVRPEAVITYIDLYRSKSLLWLVIGVADFLFSLFAAT